MKNPKKPNWGQKQRIAKSNIDPMKVSVVSDSGDSMIVVERETGKTFFIEGKKHKEIVN